MLSYQKGEWTAVMLSFLISVMLMNARPMAYMLASPGGEVADVYTIGVVGLYCYFIFLIIQSLGFCLQNKIALEKKKQKHWALITHAGLLTTLINTTVFMALLLYSDHVLVMMGLENNQDVKTFVLMRSIALFFGSHDPPR